jgi:uncharacterized caspase-like protein
MLASSRGDQYSFEDEQLGHGYFTAALLEALEAKSFLTPPPVVTLKMLLEYVPERVAKLSQERQTPWLPQIEEFNLETPLAQIGGGESGPAAKPR